MKTLMITDDVYMKLAALKGKKSFGAAIDELIVESRAAKKNKLKKYFGILSDSEADEMRASIMEVRKNFKVRL
ncbi:antitoxin VapB family protein [Candidatus Marsarchaeota archaeon]|jgi:predicted CopG family antitoxin|nr:antitoxin VapB family protein [Candidatus Marsarchaeota archaeon]MCL5115457.1 antitoxin VapB family protein [Candidatus Marsarchaeota archaeon]